MDRPDGPRWADPTRRRKAHVPADITFKTKAEIALDQLRWACAAGLPRGVVLPDAGYGNNSDLHAEITALDLTYVAGILSTTTVWPPGTAPLPPKRWLAMAAHRRAYAVIASISRSRSRSLHLDSPSARVAQDRMARRLGWNRSARALRGFAFVPPMVTINAVIRGRRNGC